MRYRVIPIIVLTAAVAVPLAWGASPPDVDSATQAARTPSVARSPDLWATINVCDTLGHPDTIGVRGSMPALSRPATAHMRFRVQYFAQAEGKWHEVSDNADSGWKRLGRLSKRVIEAGQNFTFQPPGAGGAYRLRGVVTFKWTRRARTIERVRRVTEAGHRSTAGADPEGYSAAVCDIT